MGNKGSRMIRTQSCQSYQLLSTMTGTYEQWLSFWNSLCSDIESTNLAPVTKFAYLKELLQPRVRADVGGLNSAPRVTKGPKLKIKRDLPGSRGLIKTIKILP